MNKELPKVNDIITNDETISSIKSDGSINNKKSNQDNKHILLEKTSKENISVSKDVCAVCLMELKIDDTSLAYPNTCKLHRFHEDCLLSWAKIDNSCPICKSRFKSVINIANNKETLVYQRAKQAVAHQEQGYVAYEDYGNCCHCNIDKDEALLLICDGCEACWHTYCLNPPLKEIPNGDFYCPFCIQNMKLIQEEDKKQALNKAKKVTLYKKKTIRYVNQCIRSKR